MSSPNAGIRRNRRPAGEKSFEKRVFLSEVTLAAFKSAAHESGNLSLSLYLERLAAQVLEEQGTLPLFPDTQEAHTEAA
ncbi:hypothetical protein C5E07_11335 [Pseudoclavibacter sp. RFBJ3]|uniref:hypothetical protein n=1 Tax=unclassified Pseudoclavibacter TaxID=2615177 RepID=UPI000CE9136D|nr:MULTISPECIES: hypothetical protein [unclassified Pseudoclavibacter]PPF83281.1 hypothetical protein C5C12_10410 [Pseudoclavibacter sp. RFBJ5]PPF91823.1 hypothetical protein C5E07_11335 [Pseudoclavibacter sp. RFBJ3]PPG01129.1 hypothetical protein C5C19_00620 [Pseudoclavibacter sp. RFBH5]PPG26232.1 hypothetical protein C5E13_00575 [Pseudoclavibacter sp. RFBI4]